MMSMDGVSMSEKRFDFYDGDFYDSGELMGDEDVLEILNTTDFIFEDILLLMNRLKNGTMLGTGIEREFIWNKNPYHIKIEMKKIK